MGSVFCGAKVVRVRTSHAVGGKQEKSWAESLLAYRCPILQTLQKYHKITDNFEVPQVRHLIDQLRHNSAESLPVQAPIALGNTPAPTKPPGNTWFMMNALCNKPLLLSLASPTYMNCLFSAENASVFKEKKL